VTCVILENFEFTGFQKSSFVALLSSSRDYAASIANCVASQERPVCPAAAAAPRYAASTFVE
jgi:hypothetical protein